MHRGRNVQYPLRRTPKRIAAAFPEEAGGQAFLASDLGWIARKLLSGVRCVEEVRRVDV